MLVMLKKTNKRPYLVQRQLILKSGERPTPGKYLYGLIAGKGKPHFVEQASVVQM